MYINNGNAFVQGLNPLQGAQAHDEGVENDLQQPLLAPARADSALAGREVGAGRPREGGRGRVTEFFSGVRDGFARFFGVGRHADSVTGFMRANPGLRELMTPREGSPLREAGVLDRLNAHAQHGSRATPAQIQGFAAAGERIAAALAHATPEEARSGRIQVDGVEVRSSVFTTRALTWHLMAQAAVLDEQNGVPPGDANSAMVTSGTMVMSDPDNTLFHFLNAAPTSYGRFSSHFRDRAEPDAPRSFGLPVQRGVEDFQNLLPGQGGSLLFDRIRPSEDAIARGLPDTPQLFIKLEHVGTPCVFKATEAHEGVAHAVRNGFAAIGRQVMHMFSFLSTRSASNNATEGVVRQEHVYKGRLRETVADPYGAVLQRLKDEGVLDRATVKEYSAEIKKNGLSRITSRVEQLLAQPALQNSPTRPQLEQLRRAVEESGQGLVSGAHGIERRGVEVHLSWRPPQP